uniref:Uncharacterized protein n=1 Tax=Glossina palpalis gambiensis TaxID=67801 RepID=A0A1B0AY44_9MUSC
LYINTEVISKFFSHYPWTFSFRIIYSTRCYKQGLRTHCVAYTVSISLNLKYQVFVINRASELSYTIMVCISKQSISHFNDLQYTACKCFLRAISDIKVAFCNCFCCYCCVVVIAAIINHTLCISVICSTAYSGILNANRILSFAVKWQLCHSSSLLSPMESALMCDNSISISE